jgi:hypothetical protein
MSEMQPRDIVDILRDSQPTETRGGLLLNDAADEILKLRGALEFYANPNHWMPINGDANISTVFTALPGFKTNGNGFDVAQLVIGGKSWKKKDR